MAMTATMAKAVTRGDKNFQHKKAAVTAAFFVHVFYSTGEISWFTFTGAGFIFLSLLSTT